MGLMSMETHTDSLLTHLHDEDGRNGNPRARGRSWWTALVRGAARCCPACGEGALYAHGLQVVNYCPVCDEELYHQRADRIGPLFSAFLALNIAALVAFVADLLTAPAIWPLVVAGGIAWIVSFWLLLPVAKGMIIGLQWAWRLHGFQYAAMCRPHRPPRTRGARPAAPGHGREVRHGA